jgi:hypothetical protein
MSLSIISLQMKKILPIILGLILFLSLVGIINAQIKPPYGGGLGSKVAGTVGEYYLNIKGYASPFSSISLYIDNIFIRGTVADEKGNFSISQVLIKLGLSKFCLKATDAKQLGDSESCISFPPTTGSFEKKDIFLPPTLALSKNQIPEGSSTTAYGYTMPGADVTLHLSNGNTLTTKADLSGYFEFILKDLKAGKYTVYATAKYNNIDSLAPSKKLDLTVLSKTGQAIEKVGNFWDWLWKLFTSWGLGPLWIAIPIIILIIILILKLLPKHLFALPHIKLLARLPLPNLTGIFYNPTIAYWFDLLRRKRKPLHHKYFMRY